MCDERVFAMATADSRGLSLLFASGMASIGWCDRPFYPHYTDVLEQAEVLVKNCVHTQSQRKVSLKQGKFRETPSN